MKLKTKIVIICCVLLVIASLLGEIIILVITANTRKETAIVTGYQTTLSIINKFEMSNTAELYTKKNTSAIDFTYLNYYFKQLKDDFLICIVKQPKYNEENVNSDDKTYNDKNSDNTDREDNNIYIEVFNHTIFTTAKLNDMKYIKNEELEYSMEKKDGREYLVFSGLINNNILIYKIIDISYVKDEFIQMLFAVVAVTIFISILTGIILTLVIKKILTPLQKLSEATNLIAKDYYGHRVTVDRKDEIGELAKSFNKMIEAIEIRTNNLEESEKKKTMFMANLAHELKTPMTSISGYSQTLLSTKLPEEDQEEALGYIYQECGRLERLSKKMMRLLEIDYEKNIELKEIAVLDIFESAIASTSVLIAKKDIKIKIIESGEIFNMDYDLMTDAIINLIDNSIKASEVGGHIQLIATSNSISVQDFGKGIPNEELDKVLEPFYMVDKSRNSKTKGAGLGMSLINVIAKKHNAKIVIESEINIGTKVILQFV